MRGMSMEERSCGERPDVEAAGAPKGRSLWPAMRNGLALRCPKCGKGKLFHGLLKVRDNCSSCGLDYSGHRADDLPPYLTIFIVGHLLIPGVLYMEEIYAPSTMFSVAFWSSVAVILSLLLLPRMKGAVIGQQWAFGMHGFGEGDGWAESPAPGLDEEENRAR